FLAHLFDQRTVHRSGRLPLPDELFAHMACRGAEQEATREPYAAGSEGSKQAARRRPRPVQLGPERCGQVEAEESGQSFGTLARGRRTATAALKQVHGRKWRGRGLDLGTVRSAV